MQDRFDPPFNTPAKESDLLVDSGKTLVGLIEQKEYASNDVEKTFDTFRARINDLYYKLDYKIATVLAEAQIDRILETGSPETASLAPYVLKSLNQLTLVALNSLMSREYSDKSKGRVDKNMQFLSSQLHMIDKDGSIAALFNKLFQEIIESIDAFISHSGQRLALFESRIAEAKGEFHEAVERTETDSIVADARAEARRADAMLEKASRRNLTTVIVFLFIIPFVIIGVGMIGLKKFVIEPIGYLVDAMKDIESGSFDVSAPVKADDEIGRLARAFNAMSAEIKTKVAEMSQLNRVLKESESKYRTLVENLPQRIFLKNEDLVYVSCNRNFALDFGLEEEEIVGKTDFDLLPVSLAERYRKDDARILRTGVSEEIEEPYVKDGRSLTVQTVKTPLRDERGRVTGVLSIFWDITERKRVEEELYLAKFSIESASSATFWIDSKGYLKYVNTSACENLGYEREDLLAVPFWEIDTEFTRTKFIRQWEEMKDGDPVRFKSAHRRKDGSVFPVETYVRQGEYGGVRLNFAFVNDITERIRMESQLTQAQKIESVGRLAGGVAHDFNNMLSIILGNAEMILQELEKTDPIAAQMQEIHKAARRSTELTRQLLAFARKQTIDPKVIDLNSTLEAMLKMLKRLIGEDIDLVWLPGDGLWLVKIDPSQIDQILVNLCINSRDAIQGVGKVTIETRNVVFDEQYCRDHAECSPGSYVIVAVSDNGCGMDKEALSNLFEPFFTTKAKGQGTGLGLATVYGIVRQNNGFINVYSEPGSGTTFKVYIPRYAGVAAKDQVPIHKTKDVTGQETVLLVEDEEPILKLATKMLESLGYTVFAASTPAEAAHIGESHPEGDIQLLMTDVVMPEMSGRDLAVRLLKLNPSLKCLYMSGYTANVIAHHGVLDKGVHFIHKPFSKQDLAVKIREVLDEA